MSTATKRGRAPLTPEERAERRAAEREQMKEAIEALRSTEGWQRWLRVRSQFRTYSLANQFLIAFQRPEATRVAGFRRWLSLGYAVRKGERGIRIWAPCPPTKKQIERWREAGADPGTEPRTHFRLVAVFDRSQVAPLAEFPGGPLDLDPPSEPVGGEGLSHLLKPLVAFARQIGSAVSFEAIPGSARGYYEVPTRRIVIDQAPGFSPNAQVKTLIHELSHALVRLSERGEDDPRLNYSEEEVVAEAVAYTVTSCVGLDTSGDSIPYIAGWGGEDAAVPIERYAALIDRLASRIEEAVIVESPRAEREEVSLAG